ncbi:MAG: type II 3-dehydroquinate dehydratase [Actinomycetota bacterium]|nr:type II 3-dehydroquinate dehydratase [Actinomycetota bacterium]
MERILIINGPNLNLLGERDRKAYGQKTLEEINTLIKGVADELSVEVEFFQSNHEGDLIDKIHEERKKADGIIINPGALTHYSFALHDALEAVGLPTVEVHISDIDKREEWRRHSVITPVAWKVIKGKGFEGYLVALRELVNHIRAQ